MIYNHGNNCTKKIKTPIPPIKKEKEPNIRQSKFFGYQSANLLAVRLALNGLALNEFVFRTWYAFPNDHRVYMTYPNFTLMILHQSSLGPVDIAISMPFYAFMAGKRFETARMIDNQHSKHVTISGYCGWHGNKSAKLAPQCRLSRFHCRLRCKLGSCWYPYQRGPRDMLSVRYYWQ